jgi:mannose-6-phosphate isomerase
MLLYEIQQPSDITYRVDDWGRPATPERPLHVEQALASVGIGEAPAVRRAVPAGRLVTGAHVALDLVDHPTTLQPDGRTLHLVTALDGAVDVAGPGWAERLEPFDTLVVPAVVAAYEARPPAGGRLIVAALP